MSDTAGRSSTGERRQRRGTVERLTPSAGPDSAGYGSAPSLPAKSIDRSTQTTGSVRRGPKAERKKATPSGLALPAWLGRLRYYGLALLLVATGTVVRAALTRLVGPGLPVYTTFYPLVMLAALMGGWGPGLLATLAAAVVVDYWLLPPPGFGIENFVDAAGLVFFAVMGIFMSIVAELYRRTRDHLEDLVILRTAALNQANEHFQERGEQLQAQTAELTAVNATLRESEASLAKAQALAHLANWEAHIRTNRVQGSQELYRLFNLEADFPLDAYFEKFHPEDRRRVVEAIDAAIREGKPYNIDYRIVPSPGIVRYVHAEGKVTRDDDGLPLTFFGTVQDITEHKQAEQTLRESEEKYRSIVETATEAVLMVDAEARIIFVNDRWSEIFGYSREESRRMTHFDLVFPENLVRMKERWESRKRGQGESYELRLRRKGGSAVWALIGVAPKFSPAGEFLGTLVMIADMSQRKKVEEDLRELNATLESRVAERTAQLEHRAWQLQKLTLELTQTEERERARIAGILHDDLQQVLAAAKFQVSLLGSRVKNDADAQEIAEQARDLLADAIAQSRSLSHELSSPALSRSDLCEAFEWLAEQMQKKHGFTVYLKAQDRIEVASEPLRILLYKAAQEMLFNAIKHAGVQEAKLHLRRYDGYVGLSVSDQGRGFNPADPNHALGLGLRSIRERIELLGGRLKIKSAPGKGSTFFVVLPNTEAGGIVSETDPKGIRQSQPSDE